MKGSPRMRQGVVCFLLAFITLSFGTPSLRAGLKALAAQGWRVTPARIEAISHARYGKHGMRLECRYRYDIAGQTFAGTNVDFYGGTDGQGGTVHRRYEALQLAQQSGTAVPCFHHPVHPERAVLFRVPDARHTAIFGGTALLLFWCWLTAGGKRFLGRPPRGSLRSGAALLAGVLLVAALPLELPAPYSLLPIALVALAATWFHLRATAPQPVSNPRN